MNKDILKEEEEKEDPVKKLEEIDDKYSAIDSVDAPETLGLEKKEMVEMSDDEIVSIAKDKVGDADSGKKTIEDDYAKPSDVCRSLAGHSESACLTRCFRFRE